MSEAESLEAVLEQFPADAFSCIGIVAIRNDLRDEAIRRLGDVARLPEWARLTGLFIFDEGPKSIAALTAFAKRSHGGKVYFDTQNHRSSAHFGRYAVIRALDAVGRVLANRYASAGISTEYTRGVDFLLECADPDFWKPPRIQFEAPNETTQISLSFRCIVSLAYSDQPELERKVEVRVAQLMTGASPERKESLDSAGTEFKHTRHTIAAAGGIKPFLRQTFPLCRRKALEE